MVPGAGTGPLDLTQATSTLRWQHWGRLDYLLLPTQLDTKVSVVLSTAFYSGLLPLRGLFLETVGSV